VLRLAELPARKPTRFALEPDADALEALRAELGLEDLRKLRFAGTLHPAGGKDWRLEANLGATVVQACGVTLAPVTTRIDETVTRRYLTDWVEPEASEVEMPEDDDAGPVPDTLDLGALMAEELLLALPLYPRAEGVSLGPAVFTEPGKAAMTDADARPFAALQNLRLATKPEES
jgi:uncharacterized metal-binding protein YceD (DUF177 family)